MPYNATEIVKLLETLESWVLFRKEMGFWKKILDILKTANCCKFVTECNWKVKFLETLEILVLFEKELGFSKKILDFLKTVKGTKFAVQCN